jgi:hypothetical protein
MSMCVRSTHTRRALYQHSPFQASRQAVQLCAAIASGSTRSVTSVCHRQRKQTYVGAAQGNTAYARLPSLSAAPHGRAMKPTIAASAQPSPLTHRRARTRTSCSPATHMARHGNCIYSGAVWHTASSFFVPRLSRFGRGWYLHRGCKAGVDGHCDVYTRSAPGGSGVSVGEGK